jgi:hypothetical protein
MSTRKVIRAAQNLLRQTNRIAHQLIKALVTWLLRGLLIVGRRSLSAKAGFVLPTTVLLLLVVVLTVGAISYRTFTRTQQAISERQQQVVYNAATPVIDRAKSKIEFLFDPQKDTRGSTVTAEDKLFSLSSAVTVHVPFFVAGNQNVDPYTLEGETRIDVNGDGQPDNAWRYRVDLDGDGNVNSPDNKDGWAVYSIIFLTPNDGGVSLRDASREAWEKRAKNLEVRNAPLSNASPNQVCQRTAETGAGNADPINGEGWFPDPGNSTKIRKNFQVTAYVVPDNPSGTVATLEFQQDREATAGFKWAAWFRNDLEIFPGADFNWNGAMHTEGNLFVGPDSYFRAYLVSSPQSCINSPDASEITVKENEKDQPIKGTPAFKGRIITGSIRDNRFEGTPAFDVKPKQPVGMPPNKDSVVEGNFKPLDFSLEPVTLQTKGLSEPRNRRTVDLAEDPNWKSTELNSNGQGRLRTLKEVTTPYVDDTFRADNRWGPKPTWGRDGLPIGVTSKDNAGAGSTAKIGEPITGVPALTGSDPAPGVDTASVGFDGYWERRARVEGLRLIVGQRLELGDPAGWGGPGGVAGSEIPISLDNEPLRPWSDVCSGERCNEKRQRKALWDNLAAVQATAVYHNATDTTADARDFPDACLVTTVHPGTPTTLDRSATFENLAFGLPATAIPGYTNAANPLVISDFFRGRGTNGWEYTTPTLADFKNINSPLMRSLRNLAYFAGDPNGGAPSFKPRDLGREVNPYPGFSMWGDFSNLLRVFEILDDGTSYDRLSPADKTTLHTAGCTLGMLAYNLDYLEKLKVYDPTPANDPTRGTGPLQALAGYTDAEINPAGPTAAELTVNNALLADPRYSAGLRGRIRVIDHIANGFITPANVAQIPQATRPPLAFVQSLAAFKANNVMNVAVWDNKQSNNPETYVRLLQRWRDNLGTAGPDLAQRTELNKIISLAELIVTKEQVARDRIWGFKGAYGDGSSEKDSEFIDTATWPLGDCGFSNPAAPPPNTVAGWLTELPKIKAKDGAGNEAPERAPDPLSQLCSYRPRYPVLYSLFPAKVADVLKVPSTLTVDAAYAGVFINHKDITDSQEKGRTRDRQDSKIAKTAKYILNESAPAIYTVVRPQAVALRPKTLSQGGVTLGTGNRWVLPFTAGTPAAGATPNSNRFNLLKICRERCSDPADVNGTFQLPRNGRLVRVALKDSAFYNGREMMPVRALNLDLRLMADSNHKGDLWLPQKGIIYGYREDAVSEAHIVRPRTTGWASCDTAAELEKGGCPMQTADKSAYDSKDPPLNTSNYITPKPVDYFPDPDRRPYGFRLLQGENLKRTGDEGRGLSFISDNPVYIQGNFNLHQTSSGQPLEEFTQLLTFDGSEYKNFYDRTERDLSFANREQDQWRPSEVVADAVTLLSSSFCDGSIEDGLSNIGNGNLPKWLEKRYGCGNSTRTSYFAQNRPNDKISNSATSKRGVVWVRSNLIDSFPQGVGTKLVSNHNVDEGESPILISRNGDPVFWNDESGVSNVYRGKYVNTKDGGGKNTSGNKLLIEATDNTRMNMIMVSGLVPSREGQSYGGLHNFPRFLENWNRKNLYISGAFLQLSFSTYATGPYDQEAWQPGAPDPTTGADSNEWITYYHPPNRRWGYDVGLQYASAGPVAQRFQFAEDIRSEFYSEPPANDPYVRNLCESLKSEKPNLNCPA